MPSDKKFDKGWPRPEALNGAGVAPLFSNLYPTKLEKVVHKSHHTFMPLCVGSLARLLACRNALSHSSREPNPKNEKLFWRLQQLLLQQQQRKADFEDVEIGNRFELFAVVVVYSSNVYFLRHKWQCKQVDSSYHWRRMANLVTNWDRDTIWAHFVPFWSHKIATVKFN